MNYPIDRLTAENQLKGYALWVLLTASINYMRGGISDQGSAQVIDIEWDINRDTDLPVDWFQYQIEVVIEPEDNPLDLEVTFYETIVEKSIDHISRQNYVLTVKQFLCALPWIKNGKFSEISGMLNDIDYEEFILSDIKQIISLAED